MPPPSGLEAEVRRLTDAERKGSLTATEKDKLVALRSEVDRVKKTKEDYLEKHPEHRKFVYPNEEARLKAEQEKEDQEEGSSTGGGRGGPLYGKDGRLVSSISLLAYHSSRNSKRPLELTSYWCILCRGTLSVRCTMIRS